MMITPARAGLLAAGLAFTFFTTVINAHRHGWLAWYRLSESGVETWARVTRLQSENHQTCFFRYVVNAREYEGSDQGCHAQVGEAVSLTYSPDDPAFATLSSPTGEFAFLVLGPVFMSAAAGMLGAWRVHTHSRRKAS